MMNGRISPGQVYKMCTTCSASATFIGKLSGHFIVKQYYRTVYGINYNMLTTEICFHEPSFFFVVLYSHVSVLVSKVWHPVWLLMKQ